MLLFLENKLPGENTSRLTQWIGGHRFILCCSICWTYVFPIESLTIWQLCFLISLNFWKAMTAVKQIFISLACVLVKSEPSCAPCNWIILSPSNWVRDLWLNIQPLYFFLIFFFQSKFPIILSAEIRFSSQAQTILIYSQLGKGGGWDAWDVSGSYQRASSRPELGHY